MKINVNAKVIVSGRYKIEKISSNGREIVLDWFENLITNIGLDQITTNSSQKFDNCFVGDGGNTPQPSDTQLQSLVSGSDSIFSTDQGIDTNENFTFFRRVYQFNAGTATGNLSELGVGETGSSLFSRALILDSGGSPTTISILPDEILLITYECRINQPLGDFIGSLSEFNYTMRAMLINTTTWWPPVSSGGDFSGSGSGTSAFTGTIGDVENSPSGTAYNSSSGNRTNGVYNSGSFTRTFSSLWNISQANDILQSFRFNINCLGSWQFQVTPPIEKTSNDELTVTIRITWAREGELPS